MQPETPAASTEEQQTVAGEVRECLLEMSGSLEQCRQVF